MPETRRRYDQEFRDGAVCYVVETGKPVAACARELGSTRARWATGSPGRASVAEPTRSVQVRTRRAAPACGCSVMCSTGRRPGG